MKLLMPALLLLWSCPGAQVMEFEVSGTVMIEFPMPLVISRIGAGADQPLEIVCGFESLYCERASDFVGFELTAGARYTLTASGGAVSLSLSTPGTATVAPPPEVFAVPADGSGVVFDRKMELVWILVDGAPADYEDRILVTETGGQGRQRIFSSGQDAVGYNVAPGLTYSFTVEGGGSVVLCFAPGGAR
jgi:hypothetical protein